jgi:hypothetical protein
VPTAAPQKPKKLSATQAVLWATAEVAVLQAKAAWEAAKAEAEKLRARYEDRLEPSADPKDAGKDVKVGVAGGWQIRFTRFTGGERFSIKEYRAAGHKVTPEMRPFISAGDPQVRVTVKRVKGPTKPGAVEPS